MINRVPAPTAISRDRGTSLCVCDWAGNRGPVHCRDRPTSLDFAVVVARSNCCDDKFCFMKRFRVSERYRIVINNSLCSVHENGSI